MAAFTWSLLIASAALLLGSCATSTQVHLPDGRVGYAIECSGAARTWGMCLKKAGQLCQARGYDVVAQDASTSFMASQYGMVAGASAAPNRELIIACR